MMRSEDCYYDSSSESHARKDGYMHTMRGGSGRLEEFMLNALILNEMNERCSQPRLQKVGVMARKKIQWP